LNLTVKVARDELGRDDRNRRSGYQITWFGWEELQKAEGASANQLPNQGVGTPTAATQPTGTQ
jgi:hypothetical protein